MKNSSGQDIHKIQRGLLDFAVEKCPNLGLEKRADFFVRLFEKYLPRESSILDIGGGWGFYHEPLVKRGHRHYVLDVVRPGIQKTSVILYDGNRIPFGDKAFEATLLITVLHHIADPGHMIEEARRVTRSVMVVVEDLYHHALGKFWTRLRDRIYNFEYFGHAGQFRKKEEWLRLFARKGCSLLEEKEIYTWLCGLRILNGLFVFKTGES